LTLLTTLGARASSHTDGPDGPTTEASTYPNSSHSGLHTRNRSPCCGSTTMNRLNCATFPKLTAFLSGPAHNSVSLKLSTHHGW